MAMTISGSNGVTYPDGTSQASGSQSCKAWVNFNGTGTVAIRAAYNVSSITDNGTGDYTVNFTTALQDANYSAVGTAQGSTIGNIPFVFEISGAANPTTSNCRIQVQFANAGGGDRATVCVAFFR